MMGEQYLFFRLAMEEGTDLCVCFISVVDHFHLDTDVMKIRHPGKLFFTITTSLHNITTGLHTRLSTSSYSKSPLVMAPHYTIIFLLLEPFLTNIQLCNPPLQPTHISSLLFILSHQLAA